MGVDSHSPKQQENTRPVVMVLEGACTGFARKESQGQTVVDVT